MLVVGIPYTNLYSLYLFVFFVFCLFILEISEVVRSYIILVLFIMEDPCLYNCIFACYIFKYTCINVIHYKNVCQEQLLRFWWRILIGFLDEKLRIDSFLGLTYGNLLIGLFALVVINKFSIIV